MAELLGEKVELQVSVTRYVGVFRHDQSSGSLLKNNGAGQTVLVVTYRYLRSPCRLSFAKRQCIRRYVKLNFTELFSSGHSGSR